MAAIVAMVAGMHLGLVMAASASAACPSKGSSLLQVHHQVGKVSVQEEEEPPPCGADCRFCFNVIMTLNARGSSISYTLRRRDGSLVYGDEMPEKHAESTFDSAKNLISSYYVKLFCLTWGHYNFTVVDDRGEGMASEVFGVGHYKIKVGDQALVGESAFEKEGGGSCKVSGYGICIRKSGKATFGNRSFTDSETTLFAITTTTTPLPPILHQAICDDTCANRTLTVELTTDMYGAETSWKVNQQKRKVASRRDLLPGRTYIERMCIGREEHVFEIKDKDGINSGNGEGSYSVSVAVPRQDPTMVEGDGKFEKSKTVTIPACEE